MSSLVVYFIFIKDGGTRAPLPREGVWPPGAFRVEGRRMGTLRGPPCRVVGEQSSTGLVRGEKLELHK